MHSCSSLQGEGGAPSALLVHLCQQHRVRATWPGMMCGACRQRMLFCQRRSNCMCVHLQLLHCCTPLPPQRQPHVHMNQAFGQDPGRQALP